LDDLKGEGERLRDIEESFTALFQKSPIGIAYHKIICDDSGRPVDYYFIAANANYRELRAALQRICSRDPGNEPFCRYLLKLSAEYQEEAIIALLERELHG